MAAGGARSQVNHAKTEYGASIDMRVDTPRTNLDVPGVGLRNNGRRVLTLSQLHTVGGPMDPRGAEREIELHLTGNMERSEERRVGKECRARWARDADKKKDRV